MANGGQHFGNGIRNNRRRQSSQAQPYRAAAAASKRGVHCISTPHATTRSTTPQLALVSQQFDCDDSSPSGSSRALDSSDSSSGGEGSSPVKHRKRETLPDIARRIPVDALRPFLKFSLVSAAKAMGISATTLKRLCRHYGIKRWPYRQISGIDRTVGRLEAELAASSGGAGEMVAPIAAHIHELNLHREGMVELALEGGHEPVRAKLASVGVFVNTVQGSREARAAYRALSPPQLPQVPSSVPSPPTTPVAARHHHDKDNNNETTKAAVAAAAANQHSPFRLPAAAPGAGAKVGDDSSSLASPPGSYIRNPFCVKAKGHWEAPPPVLHSAAFDGGAAAGAGTEVGGTVKGLMVDTSLMPAMNLARTAAAVVQVVASAGANVDAKARADGSAIDSSKPSSLIGNTTNSNISTSSSNNNNNGGDAIAPPQMLYQRRVNSDEKDDVFVPTRGSNRCGFGGAGNGTGIGSRDGTPIPLCSLDSAAFCADVAPPFSPSPEPVGKWTTMAHMAYMEEENEDPCFRFERDDDVTVCGAVCRPDVKRDRGHPPVVLQQQQQQVSEHPRHLSIPVPLQFLEVAAPFDDGRREDVGSMEDTVHEMTDEDFQLLGEMAFGLEDPGMSLTLDDLQSHSESQSQWSRQQPMAINTIGDGGAVLMDMEVSTWRARMLEMAHPPSALCMSKVGPAYSAKGGLCF